MSRSPPDTTVIDPDALGEQYAPDRETTWDVGVAQAALLEESVLDGSELLYASEIDDGEGRTTGSGRERADDRKANDNGPTLKTGTGVTTFGTPTTGSE